ncbi:MAG: hypothetical protein O7E57_17140 [Gammaproteobacteria bacterium]|nr:hypothetical protein [Gammaproteobacteria bacterium]
MNKSPYGLSLWIITCVGIGFGLAYLDGVGAKAIITTAAIVASGITVLLLGAWALKASKK